MAFKGTYFLKDPVHQISLPFHFFFILTSGLLQSQMSIALLSAFLIYIRSDNNQIVLHRKKKKKRASSVFKVGYCSFPQKLQSGLQGGCSLLSLLSVLKDQNYVREALLGSANCLAHIFISNSSDRRNSGEHVTLAAICCLFALQIPSIQICWVRTSRYISLYFLSIQECYS